MKIIWSHKPDIPSAHLKIFFDSLVERGHDIYYIDGFNAPIELGNYFYSALPPASYRCKNGGLVREIIKSNEDEFLRLVEEVKYLCITLFPKRYVFRMIDWQLNLFLELKPDVVLIWGGKKSIPYSSMWLIARNRKVRGLSIENSFVYRGVEFFDGDDIHDSKHFSYSSDFNAKSFAGKSKNRVALEALGKIIRHKTSPTKNKKTDDFIKNARLLGRRLLVVYGPPYYWLHEKNRAYIDDILQFHESYRDFLIDLLSINEVSIVYKPHPGGKWSERFYNNFFCLPESESFHVTNVNPLTLLRYGDKFIAHYSKLETNIVMNNKVLILPGGGFYADAGCALVAENSWDLRDHVRNEKQSLSEEERRNRDRFIGYVLDRYVLSFDDIVSMPDRSVDWFLNKIRNW